MHNRCVAGHHAARLVCDNRLKGRLFSYSDCTRAQAVPLICHRGSNISVQGSFVWPGFGTKSFFKVRPGSIGTTPEDWHEGVTVPGRLACLCSITPASNGSSSSPAGTHHSFGDHCELGQMQACSDTVNQLHRPCSKLCHNVGLSDFRENRVNSESYEEASGGSHSALCGSLETLGEAHSSNNSSTTRVIVAQAIPALAHPKTPVSDTRQTHKDQSHTSLHASPSTLVTAAVSPHRSSIRTSTCTLGSHKDGCQSWLGGGGVWRRRGVNGTWRGALRTAHIQLNSIQVYLYSAFLQEIKLLQYIYTYLCKICSFCMLLGDQRLASSEVL